MSRKTDASLWPAMFSAVGSPSAVLQLLLDKGSLTSAACFLIVVDRCERDSYCTDGGSPATAACALLVDDGRAG